MRTKCASVRVDSFRKISDKAYLLRSFDGREAIIPASQYYGYDNDVSKSDAVWISEWILQKKDVQWSSKKTAYFDSETRNQLPSYEIKKHVAADVAPVESNKIYDLRK